MTFEMHTISTSSSFGSPDSCLFPAGRAPLLCNFRSLISSSPLCFTGLRHISARPVKITEPSVRTAPAFLAVVCSSFNTSIHPSGFFFYPFTSIRYPHPGSLARTRPHSFLLAFASPPSFNFSGVYALFHVNHLVAIQSRFYYHNHKLIIWSLYLISPRSKESLSLVSNISYPFLSIFLGLCFA
jgi:hypothetical protein